jgi:hypothetical protein
MNEIVKMLRKLKLEYELKTCSGVYDSYIRIKYGIDPHDLAWIYFKDNKIILMHIKNDTYTNLEDFIKSLNGVN